MFLNSELLFPRTRGVCFCFWILSCKANTLAWVKGYPLLFKILKNLTSCAFSWKTCKKYAEFLFESGIRENFGMLTWHCVSTSWGTRLVVVLWVRVAPPCVQGLGVLTPRHSDARPGCGNRLRSYALLRTRTMFAPRLVLFCSRAMPCESRP